jgi:hypothetical protein
MVSIPMAGLPEVAGDLSREIIYLRLPTANCILI